MNLKNIVYLLILVCIGCKTNTQTQKNQETKCDNLYQNKGFCMSVCLDEFDTINVHDSGTSLLFVSSNDSTDHAIMNSDAFMYLDIDYNPTNKSIEALWKEKFYPWEKEHRDIDRNVLLLDTLIEKGPSSQIYFRTYRNPHRDIQGTTFRKYTTFGIMCHSNVWINFDAQCYEEKDMKEFTYQLINSMRFEGESSFLITDNQVKKIHQILVESFQNPSLLNQLILSKEEYKEILTSYSGNSPEVVQNKRNRNLKDIDELKKLFATNHCSIVNHSKLFLTQLENEKTALGITFFIDTDTSSYEFILKVYDFDKTLKSSLFKLTKIH